MDHIPDFMTSRVVQIGGGVVIVGIVTYVMYKKSFQKETWVDTDFPPDKVVLHNWGRGAYCPSMSPFVTKLGTYFRIAKIPYVTKEHDMGKRGPKGKIPWITFNGQPLADSQFIIEFLNKRFGVELDRGLTDTERGISRALLKLTEESLYWYLVMERWVYQSNWNWFTDHGLPSYIPRLVKKFLIKIVHGQGIGRHTKEEVYHIMEDDMTALSRVLGNKKFFFGDDPTEVDCAIFGLLSQYKYNLYGSTADKLMIEKLTNLAEYCERIKERFWPDWNENTLKGTRQIK